MAGRGGELVVRHLYLTLDTGGDVHAAVVVGRRLGRQGRRVTRGRDVTTGTDAARRQVTGGTRVMVHTYKVKVAHTHKVIV